MIQFSRISIRTPVTLFGVLVLSSGLSCAVVPQTDNTPDVTPAPVITPVANEGMHSAYSDFQKRDFAAASAGYGGISGDNEADSKDRQLAFLGQTLVYLSTDAEWRDLGEAGIALQSAEAVTVESGNVETEMLMNALSSLIGVETNISELNTKLANSTSEVSALKDARTSLEAEQVALEEALEKLKALTLGN